MSTSDAWTLLATKFHSAVYAGQPVKLSFEDCKAILAKLDDDAAVIAGYKHDWDGLKERHAESDDRQRATIAALETQVAELTQDRDEWQRSAEISKAKRQAAEAKVAALEKERDGLKAGQFWERLFANREDFPDGMTAEAVKNELADYHFIMEQVPKVYEAVTGGLLSKTNYYAASVIAAFEEHVQRLVDDGINDRAALSSDKPERTDRG